VQAGRVSLEFVHEGLIRVNRRRVNVVGVVIVGLYHHVVVIVVWILQVVVSFFMRINFEFLVIIHGVVGLVALHRVTLLSRVQSRVGLVLVCLIRLVLGARLILADLVL
jgi:hypothetical protein